ncbi:alpha/beta hydrolase [Roseobacter weihaiensis]|uniref:alpha/beta hydrolase n=1 Tax=Roseobacter weihaiensis TaxID=2763262 RepID=UPI001D0AE20A|nr:alpha/beta hydrolase [Roseobacter sp. H9]
MSDGNDWDDAFANMAHVPNADRLPDFWATRAAAYRSTQAPARLQEDLSYGDGARQRLDILWPDGAAHGLAVFVHGGYWMRLDKSYWTDLAEGARARGWAVCIPSYTLTPQARISAITADIGRAINMSAARVEGPICLAGHSAGGHLVTRMLCDDSPLIEAVRARIMHTLSISGLHDLRPLMQTQMNETLHLDDQEAWAESPVLHAPGVFSPLTCWVGGGERPEFIRQARLMAMIWQGLDVATACHIDGTHNHFTILEGLKDAQSPLTDAFLGSPPSEGVGT